MDGNTSREVCFYGFLSAHTLDAPLGKGEQRGYLARFAGFAELFRSHELLQLLGQGRERFRRISPGIVTTIKPH
jgi:hypothetical protein